MSADAPDRSGEQPAAKAGATFPARRAAAEALRLRSRLQTGTPPLLLAHHRRFICGGPRTLYRKRFVPQESARVGFTVGKVLGGAVSPQPHQAPSARSRSPKAFAATGAVDVVINPKKSVLTLEFSVVLEEIARAKRHADKLIAKKTRVVQEKSEIKHGLEPAARSTSAGFLRSSHPRAAMCQPAPNTRWKRSTVTAHFAEA